MLQQTRLFFFLKKGSGSLWCPLYIKTMILHSSWFYFCCLETSKVLHSPLTSQGLKWDLPQLSSLSSTQLVRWITFFLKIEVMECGRYVGFFFHTVFTVTEDPGIELFFFFHWQSCIYRWSQAERAVICMIEEFHPTIGTEKPIWALFCRHSRREYN